MIQLAREELEISPAFSRMFQRLDVLSVKF